VSSGLTMDRARTERTNWLCYLGEVHVAVGQVLLLLLLLVVVSRVCDAGVVLLHGLVLGEGRLLGLQLRVHHVAAHQRLGPAGHGLCSERDG